VTGGSSQPYVSETPGPRGFYNAYSLARDSGLELFQRGFDALASVGLRDDTVRRFLPHQANGRMGMVLSPLLGIEENRFHNHAVKYGNTGSASTWIGLHSVRVEQLLQPGEVLGVLGAEATKFMFGGFAYFEGKREPSTIDGDGRMSVPRSAALPPSHPRGPACN
jgi:3-oxoacyl-[acyl-carrier-protein] synthase-3